MENTARENTVLSPEDVVSFEQQGYVYLPKAFARADALAIQDSIWLQMREHGIDRHNRSTWPAGSWNGVKDNPALERGIAAPRLCTKSGCSTQYIEARLEIHLQ